MLPRVHRIPSEDFEYIRTHGTSLHHPLFSFVYCPCRGETSRFAVVAAKKKIRLAVQRHRVKRRVFHVLRPYIPLCRICVDGIFFVKPDIYTSSPEEIDSAVRTLLARAGVIENTPHS